MAVVPSGGPLFLLQVISPKFPVIKKAPRWCAQARYEDVAVATALGAGVSPAIRDFL